MSTITGIELGPDSCVLVRARRRGEGLEVTAMRIFEPAEWATDDRTRTALLADARRALGLPRAATVVAWDADASGRAAREAVLREAGFAVRSVITPPDALALLAWSRPRPPVQGPVAWLSINHHGAAIAVVQEADLLYTREFAWRIMASEHRAQAHLLRRYLYVAQLVPELRRAILAVRDSRGAAVDLAVASGNIPDLRSFTIPLIEELDIEFETIDSFDGLVVSPELAAAAASSASAVRLASAAAFAAGSGARGGTPAGWLGAAAGLMLAAGAAWWAFTFWPGTRVEPDEPPRDRRPAVSAQGRQPASPVAPESAPAASVERPPAGSPTARPPAPQPTTGVVSREPAVPAAEPPSPALPVVSGILISSDRRLAVIDGVVVGVGDGVAGRVVTRIESTAVVFREPSGRLVRVPVRTRGQP